MNNEQNTTTSETFHNFKHLIYTKVSYSNNLWTHSPRLWIIAQQKLTVSQQMSISVVAISSEIQNGDFTFELIIGFS